MWAIHTFESDRQTAISSVSSDGTFRCTYVSSCYNSGDNRYGGSSDDRTNNIRKGGGGHYDNDNFSPSGSGSALDNWVLQGFKINKVQDTTKNNRCVVEGRDSSTNRESREGHRIAPNSSISTTTTTTAAAAAASGPLNSNIVFDSNRQNNVGGGSSGSGSGSGSGSNRLNSSETSTVAPSGNSDAGNLWSGPSADVYISSKCTLNVHSNQLKRSQSGAALHAVDSTTLTFISSNASSDAYENRNDRDRNMNGSDGYDNENYGSTYNNSSTRSSDQVRNRTSIDDNNYNYSTTRLFAYGGSAGLLRIHTMDMHKEILH